MTNSDRVDLVLHLIEDGRSGSRFDLSETGSPAIPFSFQIFRHSGYFSVSPGLFARSALGPGIAGDRGSTPMSRSNAEKKKWLSTAILGSLNLAIYKLKPEDRPTWAKVDVRDSLAPIVSAVVNDQAWPDVLGSCRRGAAVQNHTEDAHDHVRVVVEDVLAASNGRTRGDSSCNT
jgi:hypothetical protein